jgi:hypothetical protein
MPVPLPFLVSPLSPFLPLSQIFEREKSNLFLDEAVARRLLQQTLLAALGRCPAGSDLRREAGELLTAFLTEHSAVLVAPEPVGLAETLAAPAGRLQFAAFLHSLRTALEPLLS